MRWNWQTYHLQPLVLTNQKTIPFDKRLEIRDTRFVRGRPSMESAVRCYATSEWSGEGRSSCRPVAEGSLIGVSESLLKLLSM